MRVRIAQTATLDMWQCAPEPSVALMPSTQPSKACAPLRRTSSASAESGGLSSAVTANSPRRSTRSSRPRDEWPGRSTSGAAGSAPMSWGCGRAAASCARFRRSRARRSHVDEPFRRVVRAAAGPRRSRAPAAHREASLVGLHPDAGHLGIDFAMAVGPDAAAGAVAHAPSGSSSGRTCRSSTGRSRRTSGSRTGSP